MSSIFGHGFSERIQDRVQDRAALAQLGIVGMRRLDGPCSRSQQKEDFNQLLNKYLEMLD
jgi:hypothetical protein